MSIYWTETAEAERDRAIEYIAQTSLDAALIQLDEIIAQTRRLERFPHLGRPGRKPGTRELSINRTPFVVTYRVIGDHIQILHFRHGSRRN